jgi:hypothetical protein
MSEETDIATPILQDSGKIIDKKDRFRRVAARRTQMVIRFLRRLGNCANKNAYDYSPEDVDKILAAISEEVKMLELRFKRQQRIEFKL